MDDLSIGNRIVKCNIHCLSFSAKLFGQSVVVFVLHGRMGQSMGLGFLPRPWWLTDDRKIWGPHGRNLK